MSLENTLALIGLCLVAFLTRQQAIALIPAILTAPLLVVSWREALRRYLPMYLLAAVAALFVVVVQTARNLYQRVQELAQHRAGNLRTIVDETLQVRARQVFQRATDAYKIRAEKIHLG